MDAVKTLILICTIIVTAVHAWITGARMRRRIKRTLGIRVKNEMELTSLKTWMAVENEDEKNRGGRLG